jgi:hypothetical protein
MNALETIDYKGYTIKVYQDEDASSPREDDNVGTMYCEHRGYDLGDKKAENPFIQDEETGKWKLRDDIAVALPLYLLDHSGLSIRTHSYSDVDPGEWDSGQVGVIYATKEKVRAEYGDGPDAIARAEKYMRGEVKTYDDFLRGNVLGYVVEKDGEHIASCWGFYPDTVERSWSWEKEWAYMLDEARSAADADIEEKHKSEASFAL